MRAIIKSIEQNSPASKSSISPGDILHRINGTIVEDVLDYMYLTYDEKLLIEVRNPQGKIKLIKIEKPEGEDLGLQFDTFLMDKQKSCSNKCIFCFIDQLPKGMRKTLYYKDDDLRLSFLQGNYITLSNLTKHDMERIIKLRISPINISVHTMDKELRNYMLGRKNDASGLSLIYLLAAAGIEMNCQIVCCPGLNDGEELKSTIEKLILLGKSINSVSIVPVGLTKHRDNLPKLQLFDKKTAFDTVRLTEKYAKECLQTRGKRVFYCADEFYIISGIKLPTHSYYENYPQLQNGVGMMRLFINEFMHELAKMKSIGSLKTSSDIEQNNPDSEKNTDNNMYSRFISISSSGIVDLSIATGFAAFNYIVKLLMTAKQIHDTINVGVYAIRNDFFGESITVSGLITAGDIIAQLKGKNLGKRLLIPQNMLRSQEDVFLDDITVSQLSDILGVPIRIVAQDGADLLHAIVES